MNNLNFIAEVGASFVRRGNDFVNNSLKDAIPWNIGLRYDSPTLIGVPPSGKQLITDLDYRRFFSG